MVCCWTAGKKKSIHKTSKPRSHKESKSRNTRFWSALPWRLLHLITYPSPRSSFTQTPAPTPSLAASPLKCRGHGRGSCPERGREHGYTAGTAAAHGGSVRFLVLPPLEAPGPTCFFRRSSGVPADLNVAWGLTMRGPLPPGLAVRGPGNPRHAQPPPRGTRSAFPQTRSPPCRAGVPSHRPGAAKRDPSPPRGGPAAGPALRPFPWPRRPSWRRLKTAQSRFENSPPFPPPPHGSGEPPLAITPGAQNAP